MAFPWPDAIPHGDPNFSPVGGGMSGGSYPGLPAAVTASDAGPHWRATVGQLPIRTRAQLLAARKMQHQLEGGSGAVIVPCCDGDLTPQVPGGTTIAAALNVDHDSGATTVRFSTSGSWRSLRGGEHFSVDNTSTGRRLHRVLEVLDLDGGDYTVRITPGLRESATTGTVLDFANPSCTMYLVDGFRLPTELGRFSAIDAVFEEWFDRSPQNAPMVDIPDPEPPPPTIMGIRYRVLHTHDGDVWFEPTEYGWLDAWGGDDIDGTPISSTPYAGSIGNARDGSGSTSVQLYCGGYVGLRFDTPIEIPPEGYLSPNVSNLNRMPSDLVCEVCTDETIYTDPDAATWTVYRTYTSNPSFAASSGAGAETRYYALLDETDPDVGPTWEADNLWRRQRLRALTIQAGSGQWGLSELRWCASPGDTVNAPGSTRGFLVWTGSMLYLFDGDAANPCTVYAVPNAWFELDSGRVPQAKIAEVMLVAGWTGDAEQRAPLTFVFEGSNWEGKTVTISSHSTTPWAEFELRRFLV